MKAVLAWIGLVTVFLSLCVLFVMFFAPNPDDGTLAPLKSVRIANAPPPPPAVTTVSDCAVLMPQVARVQRLRRSFTIVASITNYFEGPCRSTLEVFATAFEVQPKSLEITLNPKPPGAKQVRLSVLPKEVGEQQLIFNVKNPYNMNDGSETYDIEVRQYPGIPISVSQWFPLATLLLGSISIPWWVDWLRKWRRKRPDGI
jgi:hypothetical protein